MPEEIPYRLIKLFSFIGDTVLDPFVGSGTTLKVAKDLNRHFIGYELYGNYKDVMMEKIYYTKPSIGQYHTTIEDYLTK